MTEEVREDRVGGWREIPPDPFTKGVREGGMTGEDREVFLMLEIWYRKCEHDNGNENGVVIMMAGE
jgi:hypothetical protein